MRLRCLAYFRWPHSQRQAGDHPTPDPNHRVFQQSVWQPLLMSHLHFSTSRAKRESRRDWAVRKIIEFVEQEFRWAEDVRKRLCRDDEARNHFAGSVNLLP